MGTLAGPPLPVRIRTGRRILAQLQAWSRDQAGLLWRKPRLRKSCLVLPSPRNPLWPRHHPKPVWPLTPCSFSASTLASSLFPPSCPAPTQEREQPVPARGARLPAGALAAASRAVGAMPSTTTTQDSARRAGCAAGRNMKVDFGGAGRGRSSQRVRAAVRPWLPLCGRSRGWME